MFSPLKKIPLYRSRLKRHLRRLHFVCEWRRSGADKSTRRSRFVIEARYEQEAWHAGTVILRDLLGVPHFKFAVRPPTWLERWQLKVMPVRVLGTVERFSRREQLRDRNFADGLPSADPTCKT